MKKITIVLLTLVVLSANTAFADVLSTITLKKGVENGKKYEVVAIFFGNKTFYGGGKFDQLVGVSSDVKSFKLIKVTDEVERLTQGGFAVEEIVITEISE